MSKKDLAPIQDRPEERRAGAAISAEEARRLADEGDELRRLILKKADAASRLTPSDLRVRAR